MSSLFICLFICFATFNADVLFGDDNVIPSLAEQLIAKVHDDNTARYERIEQKMKTIAIKFKADKYNMISGLVHGVNNAFLELAHVRLNLRENLVYASLMAQYKPAGIKDGKPKLLWDAIDGGIIQIYSAVQAVMSADAEFIGNLYRVHNAMQSSMNQMNNGLAENLAARIVQKEIKESEKMQVKFETAINKLSDETFYILGVIIKHLPGVHEFEANLENERGFKAAFDKLKKVQNKVEEVEVADAYNKWMKVQKKVEDTFEDIGEMSSDNIVDFLKMAREFPQKVLKTHEAKQGMMKFFALLTSFFRSFQADDIRLTPISTYFKERGTGTRTNDDFERIWIAMNEQGMVTIGDLEIDEDDDFFENIDKIFGAVNDQLEENKERKLKFIEKRAIKKEIKNMMKIKSTLKGSYKKLIGLTMVYFEDIYDGMKVINEQLPFFDSYNNMYFLNRALFEFLNIPDWKNTDCAKNSQCEM
eukprot:499285_1